MPKKHSSTINKRANNFFPSVIEPSVQIQNPSQNLDQLKNSRSKPSLVDFSPEVLMYIFSFLDDRQLAIIGFVSRTTYHLARDPQLQRQAEPAMRNYLQVLPKRMISLSLLDNHRNEINRCKHIQCLAEFSDGLIIVGACDATVRLWNLKTRRCEKLFLGHRGYVKFVAKLSKTEIVSACEANEIRVWDVETGRCKKRIDTGEHLPNCGIVVSSHQIITGSAGELHCSFNDRPGDGSLLLWDLETSESKIFNGHTNGINCLIQSKKDGMVITGSGDKTIRVWDWKSQKCIQTLVSDNYISGLTERSDGLLVSCNKDTLIIWDRNTTKSRKIQTNFQILNAILNVACLPDDKIFVVTEQGFCIWDINSDKPLKKTKVDAEHEHCVLITKKGQVAIGTEEGLVNIREFAFHVPETTIEDEFSLSDLVRKNKECRP